MLRRLTFDVYEGDIVSLIGESGCGKTILLRIIQGLIRRDACTVRVDGIQISTARRPDRRIDN